MVSYLLSSAITTVTTLKVHPLYANMVNKIMMVNTGLSMLGAKGSMAPASQISSNQGGGLRGTPGFSDYLLYGNEV